MFTRFTGRSKDGEEFEVLYLEPLHGRIPRKDEVVCSDGSDPSFPEGTYHVGYPRWDVGPAGITRVTIPLAP